MTRTSELAVLQGVRLKGGLADLPLLCTITGLDEASAGPVVDGLAARALIADRRGRYRLTVPGRAELDAGLATERAALDEGAVHAAHESFMPLNTEFKELVHDWQLRDGEVNDHGDATYDAAVLDRLEALNRAFVPVADRFATIAPRLAPYPGRFATALAHVRAGDHRYLLSPMLDSYHQVWFELHEDLLGLAGLERLREAAAGRAE